MTPDEARQEHDTLMTEVNATVNHMLDLGSRVGAFIYEVEEQSWSDDPSTVGADRIQAASEDYTRSPFEAMRAIAGMCNHVTACTGMNPKELAEYLEVRA